ncbi:MAG: flagellar biosynthetic protein FliO [Pseudomonadota bacterium]|nr:flagellar biosynthetic protein FliO [Pseudomonadota bacterium]
MLGLNESFFASKSLTLAAVAIAFLAAAGLLSIMFRFTFRRRLRLPRNGRARLPRLGTVDAFDLDRQRQLVIVRRDNVEHLLMIGGPNDVVIESDIIRAESRDPRDLRETRIRDKELRDATPVPAGISWPSPAEAPPPNTPRRKMPFPPAAGLEWETELTAAVPIEESGRDSAPPIVLPTPRRPVFPLPPRRMPPPVTPFGQGTSNPHEPLHGGAGPPQKPESGTTPAKGFPRAPVATPFLRPQALRQVLGRAAKPAPSGTSETPPADPLAPSSLPGFEEIPTSPPGDVARRTEFSPAPATQSAESAAPAYAASRLILEVSTAGPAQDGAVSLEEEMARLLGRAPG